MEKKGKGSSIRVRHLVVASAISLALAIAAATAQSAAAATAAAAMPALGGREFHVAIVVDILKPKFQDVIDGFRETLDRQLGASGAKADYSVYDTKTDPAKVPGILEAIRAAKPDLICAINNPAAFADRNISLKLGDPAFRIVSENCIPLQSGVAREWKRPGGNITGVGVFVQMTSLIKLAKMIDPGLRKLVFFSWDRMVEINAWFVADLSEACRQEGIELAEVKYLASAEEEFDFLLQCDKKGEEYFGIEGISAWIHRDGSYADMTIEESAFVKKNIRHFPTFAYDEAALITATPAGTCVIWKDLGAQLAEKGMKLLQGAKPGDIPWDYPRKYNIILNLAAAKAIGMAFPQALVSAAYRVYTDYQGSFVGRKD